MADTLDYGPWLVQLKGWGGAWFTAVYSSLEGKFIVNGPLNWQTTVAPMFIEDKKLL